jgi:hypothetical protein
VLGHLGDDVVAALAVHLGDALDGEVGGLGGAGGEDDLLGGRADELGDLLAGLLDALLGLPAEAVVAAAALPKMPVRYGIMASSTRGSSGVVAWLSI